MFLLITTEVVEGKTAADIEAIIQVNLGVMYFFHIKIYNKWRYTFENLSRPKFKSLQLLQNTSKLERMVKTYRFDQDLAHLSITFRIKLNWQKRLNLTLLGWHFPNKYRRGANLIKHHVAKYNMSTATRYQVQLRINLVGPIDITHSFLLANSVEALHSSFFSKWRNFRPIRWIGQIHSCMN